VKVPGKNGFATVQVLRKYQKELKRIPTVKLSFTVDLIFQQTLKSLPDGFQQGLISYQIKSFSTSRVNDAWQLQNKDLRRN
jgi:hypothetical protein